MRQKLTGVLTALLVAGPAAGLVSFNSMEKGFLPEGTWDDEPCFPETIDTLEDTTFDTFEVRVNPAGVRNDGDDDTFLLCQDAGDDTINCMAGFPDGQVSTCVDTRGPHILPEEDDRLYMFFNDQGDCDVHVERVYGEPNPNCRTECNAETATVTVNHQDEVTVEAGTCARLTIPDGWGPITPHVESLPETDDYPVSFHAESCNGSKSASFTQDWEKAGLVQADSSCEIFVRFDNPVKFAYYVGEL